jgi:hypothetical protein
MELPLIDEHRFILQPFILGKGQPIINNFEKQTDLLLIGRNEYESGVIERIHQPG